MQTRPLMRTLLLSAISGALSMSQSESSLEVRVVDSFGSRLPAVQIVLEGRRLPSAVDLRDGVAKGGIEPGEYLLRVNHAGFQTMKKTISISAGRNIELIAMKVTPNHGEVESVSVRGHVVSQGGNQDVVVRLVSVFDDRVLTTLPSSQGFFQFQAIPPGRYVVFVLRNGKLGAWRELTAIVGVEPPTVRIE